MLSFEKFDSLVVESVVRKVQWNTWVDCLLTWQQAKDRGVLTRLHSYLNEAWGVWFAEGDPYKHSKPFTIMDIVMVKRNNEIMYDLWVRGQYSERIKAKWERVLGEFFQRPVSIFWHSDKE